MNEELDELASAYADGEATPQEMAQVEASPDLLDLVEEFRALRLSSLPTPSPDDVTRTRHLGAALDLFDELHATTPTSIGVTAASAESPTTDSSVTDSPTTHSAVEPDADTHGSVVVPFERPKRRMPATWLLNAAAAVVVVGGVGFAVTQLPSNSESAGDTASNTASNTVIASDEDRAFDAASAADTGNSAALEADSGATDEDAADDATAETSQAEEAGEGAPADSADSTPFVDKTPFLEARGSETATELLAEFDQLGTDRDLLPGPHRCEADLPDLLGPLFPAGAADITNAGYIPIDYGGQPADLIVITVGEERQPVLVGLGCTIISDE